MSNQKFDPSWLDGFLYAIASLDRGERECFSCAFVFDLIKGGVSESLTEFYRPDADITVLSSVDIGDDWEKNLNSELLTILLQKPLDCEDLVNLNLEARRSYCTSRIMDALDSCFSENEITYSSILKVEFPEGKAQYKFFVFSFSNYCLALQFSCHQTKQSRGQVHLKNS